MSLHSKGGLTMQLNIDVRKEAYSGLGLFWVRPSHVGGAGDLFPSFRNATHFPFSFLLTAATAHHRPLVGDRLIAHSTRPCINHSCIALDLVLFWLEEVRFGG